MGDLGRGIRDTEVAGSLWVRRPRSRGIYCRGRLAAMKNNCRTCSSGEEDGQGEGDGGGDR